MLEGLINKTDLSIPNIDLSSLTDGIITSTLIVTDPNGNIGEPQLLYYQKLSGKISLIGSTLGALSIKSFDKEISVKVFPNPTNDIVTVIIPKDYVLEKVEMYNSLGQLVEKYTKSTISLQNLSGGHYFLKIYTSEGTATKIIIKL
ncbi:MAG: hypothetical protein ACI87N_001195 [Flavobacteriales bacterium]|jgi:hypothetical protein